MNEETKLDAWYEEHYKSINWSKKHANPLEHFKTYLTERSISTRKITPCKLNVSYNDNSERTKIDYFYPPSKEQAVGRPVYVYLHGGYWQQSHKDLYSCVTVQFTKHGFNAAVVGYDLAPACSIRQIIAQVTNAVNDVYTHFNQSQLIVCGHSAGAYMAAVIAKMRPEVFYAVVLISGIYDLCPLLKTTLNDALKLKQEEAEELTDEVMEFSGSYVHALIFVGGEESPEFIRQNKDFYRTLLKNNNHCLFKTLHGEDHFSIVESLTDEQSVICQDLLLLGNCTG